jgi:hypothetical protein
MLFVFTVFKEPAGLRNKVAKQIASGHRLAVKNYKLLADNKNSAITLLRCHPVYFPKY